MLKQARGQLADDRADIAIEALDEDIATIKQQIESIATVEQDFVEFVEFALSTVEGFRDKFWQLDQEHQVWCKQLLFPDGFSVSRDKKVYTPTISDFYLCINTEKSHENDSFTADSSIWYTRQDSNLRPWAPQDRRSNPAELRVHTLASLFYHNSLVI